MLQKLTMFGPMDTDTSPEEFKPGMARYRLNIRALSSENGEDQSSETVKGNTLVSFTLPSGTNTEIGSYEDKKTKKIYYFIHNTSYNHLILEYNSVGNTIAKVFQDSVNILNGQTNILNFQVLNLITGINVVELDSKNHLLYWTDGYISTNDPNVYNEPKKINIEKGKYFMAGNYTLGYKTPFNPEILYRIKQSSECGPTYVWNHPVLDIEASSVTPQIDGAGYVDVKFDTVVYDPNSEFNTGTYSWTVGTSGFYTVIAALNIVCGTPGASSVRIAIFVNGVNKVSNLYSVGTTATDYYLYGQLQLAATDIVKVSYTIIAAAGTITVQGVVFESLYISATHRVNYLLKQMPVFKTQFVYDDNDVSSWSPWSPYAYPSVIHSFSGNDIFAQDDSISVIVDTGINIVTKIRIAVKMLGERLVNNVLEPLEFALIAELNKVDLLIADDSTYSFTFLNDGNYTPIYINESIKLFDAVPLASKAQDLIIDGRVVDGLITENQDLVPVDLKMHLTFVDIGTFPDWNTLLAAGHSFLKSGGVYKYGIVYSDHGGRLGTTNLQRGASTVLLPNGTYGTTMYVPFLTETGYAAPHAIPNTDMSYVPQVNMEIYNAPPTWATHYTIVRSKNEAITKYFQFPAENIQYVDVDGHVVAANVATDLYVYTNNILGRYLFENNNSELVYDFTPGDRIRFIANTTGGGTAFTNISAFFAFNDTQIGSYSASDGIIHIKMTSDVPLTMGNGVLFEVYTPARSVINDNEFLYEIGECFPLIKDIHGNLVHTFSGTDQLINAFTSSGIVGSDITAQVAAGHGLINGDKVLIKNAGYSVHGTITTSNATNVIITEAEGETGLYNGSAGTIYKAATGILKSGDCFRVNQNMPWVYTGTVYRLYSFVENMNISNLWVSNAWDYARPNVVDDNVKRVTRESTCIWSEAFIAETLINGLSTVYDTNFQTYEQKYGGIYKLHNENLWLDCFQELKCSRIPIQQNVINGTQGEKIVGQSTEILGRIPDYYAGEFGIGKHPESFGIYGPAKYFIDVNRGVVLRLSRDGLTAISDTCNMHNYFSNKCKDVLAYNGRINIYGVYDVKFGEYIISFRRNGEPAFVGETLVFNEDNNAWSSFYSYLPDGMCTNGVNIISFKAGALYTHNTNAGSYNNFYGVQYHSKVYMYCNVAPSNEKEYIAMSLETIHPWIATIETPISDENPGGQTTSLIELNFQRKIGFWYSPIYKDDTTPNTVAGPPYLPNARFEGNPMIGQYAFIKLEYTGSNYNRIFACNIQVINIPRSNV